MDLNFTPQEEAFRADVRAFLAAELPPRIAEAMREGRRLAKADHEEWHAILEAKGWLVPQWPTEWGGAGWSVMQRYIYEAEAALAHAPPVVPFAFQMLGPVLIAFGNDAQKAHWLPRIRSGADWWCQGYSEPGAGSDLASLTTSARREGDHYIVNGQKTWTTYAHYANMMFCLVRTSSEGKRQQGISFLLIDMTTPGIEVRPIHLLDGEHEVNDVFFTDVRVPVANLVGEENQGWTYAKYLLTHERTNLGGVDFATAALARLKVIAARQRRGGRPVADDPVFAARLARIEIELENMRTTNLRILAAAGAGHAPAAESSMLKIRGTEILQAITDLSRRSLGAYAAPFQEGALSIGWNGAPVGPDYAAPVAARYFNNRKVTIFGGSNEIQREIITKAILGL